MSKTGRARDADRDHEVERRRGGERIEALPEARRDAFASTEAVPDRVAVTHDRGDSGDVRADVPRSRPTTRAADVALGDVGHDHGPSGGVPQ